MLSVLVLDQAIATVSSDRDSGLTVVWQILAAYFSCILFISEELFFPICDLKKARSTSISSNNNTLDQTLRTNMDQLEIFLNIVENRNSVNDEK